MYFPHPVLGTTERPYGDLSTYTLSGSDFWKESGIDLSFEHKLENCPDLEKLIADGMAIFSTEVSGNGSDDHLRLVQSGRNRIEKVHIPNWAIDEAASLTVIGRVIAQRKFNFTPKGVVDSFKGQYEILPGTVLAIHHAVCQITPPAESPLIEVFPSSDRIARAEFFSGEKIRLEMPQETYDELVEISNAGCLATPQMKMIQHGVLVEAIGEMRAHKGDAQPWMIRIKDLAEQKTPPVDLMNEDVSITEIVDRLFESPLKLAINAFCLQIRQSGRSDES